MLLNPFLWNCNPYMCNLCTVLICCIYNKADLQKCRTCFPFRQSGYWFSSPNGNGLPDPVSPLPPMADGSGNATQTSRPQRSGKPYAEHRNHWLVIRQWHQQITTITITQYSTDPVLWRFINLPLFWYKTILDTNKTFSFYVLDAYEEHMLKDVCCKLSNNI